MKTNLLFCAFSLALLGCSKSTAQTLTLTLDDISPALDVNGSFDGGANYQNKFSGVMNFTPTLEAFCVEPLASMSYGDVFTYSAAPVAELPQHDQIGRLLGAYSLSAKSAEDAAAVQWAIWEVLTETSGTVSLGTGSTRIHRDSVPAVANLANQYLAEINNVTSAGFMYLRSDQGQDIVTIIPEPGGWLLAGISAFGWAVSRRRKTA